MKNLIRISILALVTICVFGMFGCEKEADNVTEIATLKSVSYNQEIEEYLTKIGIDHNNVLDYVGKNGDVALMSREQRFNLAKDFTKSNNQWSDIMHTGDGIFETIDNNNSITNLLSGPQFSDKAMSYIDELDNVFKDALNTVQHEEPYSSEVFNSHVDVIISNIFKNENVEIDTDKNVCNEFGAIISTCYLAKATYGYWYSSANDSKSLWYPYLDLSSSSKLPPWVGRVGKAIKVAAVDTWAWVSTYEVTSGDLGDTYTWDIPTSNAAASEASGSAR